jgi:hypothetical protein
MKTIIDLANEALAVQDACNLSGVAQGFARAMLDLRQHTSGTDETNNHAITILWVDKLASLAGIQDLNSNRVRAAYEWALEIVEE